MYLLQRQFYGGTFMPDMQDQIAEEATKIK